MTYAEIRKKNIIASVLGLTLGITAGVLIAKSKKS